MIGFYIYYLYILLYIVILLAYIILYLYRKMDNYILYKTIKLSYFKVQYIYIVLTPIYISIILLASISIIKLLVQL